MTMRVIVTVLILVAAAPAILAAPQQASEFRTISLRVAAHQSLRSMPSWKDEVAPIVAEASKVMEQEFKIRLKLNPIDIVDWDSKVTPEQVARQGRATLIGELDATLGPSGRDLLVGIFPITAATKETFGDFGGFAPPFWRTLVVRPLLKSSLPEDQALQVNALLLVHEIVHIFGGVHVQDPGDLMADGISVLKTDVSISDVNRQIVNLMRNIDLQTKGLRISREQYSALIKIINAHWAELLLPKDNVDQWFRGVVVSARMALQDGRPADAISFYESFMSFSEYSSRIIIGLIDIQDSLLVRVSTERDPTAKKFCEEQIQRIDGIFGENGPSFREQLHRPRP